MSWQQGRIKAWNDAKGFGFISADNSADELFFHISASRGSRPKVGQRVEYQVEKDPQGRLRAKSVRPLKSANTAKSAQSFKASHLPQWLALALLVLAIALWQIFSGAQTPSGQNGQYNPQLTQTLQLISQGGPYPYPQDNTVFHNRERLLPQKPRGYYREYTVDTPGLSHRGPRRVVTGGQPPEVWYYTEDHYRSFIRLEPNHAPRSPLPPQH